MTWKTLAALASLLFAGCVRPDVYPMRKEPAVKEGAVLWTFVPIARAPNAYFAFHLRLTPAPDCPLVVWQWGDGDLSAAESDCSPGDTGPSVYEAHHEFRRGGDFEVTASVIERGRLLSRAQYTVHVLPGPGQE